MAGSAFVAAREDWVSCQGTRASSSSDPRAGRKVGLFESFVRIASMQAEDYLPPDVIRANTPDERFAREGDALDRLDACGSPREHPTGIRKDSGG